MSRRRIEVVDETADTREWEAAGARLRELAPDLYVRVLDTAQRAVLALTDHAAYAALPPKAGFDSGGEA